MKIQLLNILLTKNKYGSDVNNSFDMNSVANLVIKNKKIGDYNCSYLFSYQNVAIKDLFESIKLNGNYSIIADLYKVFKEQLLTKLINNVDNSIIVIVPSDPARFVERGFGFNEMIMKMLITDGYHCVSPLIKTDTSVNNSKLNKMERISKPNQFKIYDHQIVDNLSTFQKIIILDDIVTTGTTILHCIETLNIEGAKISSVAIAGE